MDSFKERVQEVLSEERTKPRRWMYLSFADTGFRGGVVLKAHGITDAMLQANALGINPGGQVLGADLSKELMASVPGHYRNRLLGREEIQEIWPDAKSIRDHQKDNTI